MKEFISYLIIFWKKYICFRWSLGLLGRNIYPLVFSLVLGLLEATLFQWSFQIDYYNQNSVQTLSIFKVGSIGDVIGEATVSK